MAQTSSIIDDDNGTAKDLWEAIASLYTTSNEQTVLNLMNELEQLEFNEQDSWETHLNKFHDILGRFAALRKAIPDTEKSSKRISTLPGHFALLAMVSNNMSFQDLINAVQTELTRNRMKQGSRIDIGIPRASLAPSERAYDWQQIFRLQIATIQLRQA